MAESCTPVHDDILLRRLYRIIGVGHGCKKKDWYHVRGCDGNFRVVSKRYHEYSMLIEDMINFDNSVRLEAVLVSA